MYVGCSITPHLDSRDWAPCLGADHNTPDRPHHNAVVLTTYPVLSRTRAAASVACPCLVTLVLVANRLYCRRKELFSLLAEVATSVAYVCTPEPIVSHLETRPPMPVSVRKLVYFRNSRWLYRLLPSLSHPSFPDFPAAGPCSPQRDAVCNAIMCTETRHR